MTVFALFTRKATRVDAAIAAREIEVEDKRAESTTAELRLRETIETAAMQLLDRMPIASAIVGRSRRDV